MIAEAQRMLCYRSDQASHPASQAKQEPCKLSEDTFVGSGMTSYGIEEDFGWVETSGIISRCY